MKLLPVVANRIKLAFIRDSSSLTAPRLSIIGPPPTVCLRHRTLGLRVNHERTSTVRLAPFLAAGPLLSVAQANCC
jgi:hypothetical protein